MAYEFEVQYAGPPVNGNIKGWSPEDPITANRMNNIEAGIVEAWNRAFDTYSKSEMNNTLSTLQTNLETSIHDVNTLATDALSQAQTAQGNTIKGSNAWDQIQGALVRTNSDVDWPNLAERMQSEHAAIYTEISDVENALVTRLNNIYNPDTRTGTLKDLQDDYNALLLAYSNALRTYQYDSIKRGQAHEDLDARFLDDESQITQNTVALTSTVSMLNDAKGPYGNIDQRLDMIDGGGNTVRTTVLSTDFTALQTEVVNARGKNSENTDNTTLSQRFAQDEALINQRLAPGDVRDYLTSSETNKPLSANQGRVLDEKILDINTKIGGDFNNINTVAAAINSIGTSAAASANSYTDTLLGNGFSAANTVTAAVAALNNADTALDGRLDSIEDELQDARPVTGTNPETDEPIYGTLDDRLDAIEDAAVTTNENIANVVSEIHAARTSSIVRTMVPPEQEGDEPTYTDTTYGSLDARFESIEGNVNTIATELGMMTQAGAIEETNSKVDRLNDNVLALGKEIGMLSDDTTLLPLANAIDRSNTIIDQITTELEDARIQIGEDENTNEPIMSTLDQRLDSMDAATTALSHIVDQVADDSDPEHPIPAGLVQRMTAAETALGNKASSSDLSDLAGRVSDLETEPKSATTIITEDCITYHNETGLPTIYTDNTKTIAITPTSEVDYLLEKDDKYYYWKYINNAWELISGGGSGSGNTSGYDMTAAQYQEVVTNQTYAENTDYYVTRTDGIHHYRYVLINDVLTEIEIGSVISKDNIKKYNMMRVDTTRLNTETNQEEDVSYLNLYEFDYGVDNTIIDDQSASVHLRAQIELPKGGGGAASTGVNKLVRIGDQSIQTIVGSQVILRCFYSSWDSDGVESSAGEYVLRAGDVIIDSDSIPSGAFNEVISGFKENTAGYKQFDVTEYCRTGATTFNLTVTVNGINLGKSWTVNVIDLHLESDAPDTLLISAQEPYDFPFKAYGALNKTLYVVIDNDTEHKISIPLNPASSGRENSCTIPAQNHGVHSIEMYLVANIGGIDRTTDSIYREYIWYDVNDIETPVILASPYNGKTISAQQYSNIEIPYQVYKKDATSIDVYYYVDGSESPFDHVTLEDTNTETLSYLASTTGNHLLVIKVDNQTITVNLVISAIEGVDISPIDGAIIDFDPSTLTNTSANRLPTWGGYALTASENFNWSEDISGGGYKQDDDGKCFIVKAGSYVDLNYKMFENNVFDSGAELKIIFKTKAVRRADAIWFSNTGAYNNKTVGIQLGAHTGWLKTDKAVDVDQENIASQYDDWVSGHTYSVDDLVVYKEIIYKCIKAVADDPETTDVNETTINPKDASDNWLAMGKIDTGVLSTNSYLYLPYSEKDKIELDININKYISGTTNNFIMSYEDGVPSKAYAYTYSLSGDGLIHNNGIRIGSADCDVYIYRLRIYNKALSTAQILQNFIADGQNIDEKISRYNKNCIYWDQTQNDGHGRYFTSPSGTAVLDPIKLAEKMPDVKILMLDTPSFTVGKKNFIPNSTLRCIHARGGKVYASRGDADNWFFDKGLHAGQGTTSDNYGQSARNVDFLFICDKVHWPTKEKNVKKTFDITKPENKDYQSSVIVGENATKWDSSTETWIPTTIWDSENEEWVPNESILSASELQNWVAHAPDYCLDWKGDNCKVALTSTSIPNNYFNLKVNVASSENVNNALFQERYNQFLSSVYQSPAYKRDHKIKNDMEFVPAVLFVRENDPTVDSKGNYTKHNEFNDTKWHFYALGNIGDSKKTDYTRAYNPKDMNEFTVENSDNNTNNGQFQSGVFMYNGIYAVETDYAEWSNTKAYAQNDIVTKEGKMYQRSGATMAALEENETASWVAADWTDITPTTTKTIYYAPRTNPNPMDYLYGIDPEEWNVKMTVPDGDGKYHYVNRKHETLVEEEFDGDHSFEFRYACMGDYRDGDLINDTTGVAKAQFNTNHQIVLDFYEWLVTATNEQFEDEASHWIIPEAMEFFYAYTHYYTMMDNRAKNTFWHWGKNYISTNDANGTNYNTANAAVATAQATYDSAASDAEDAETAQRPIINQAEADIATANETLTNDPENAEALAAKAQAEQNKAAAEAIIAAAEATKKSAKSQLNTRILKRDELKFLYDHADCYIVDNAEAAINDGRRFDLWAYDMDTAAGIDNNGALVFPYGKEDEDYRVEGEESSGYAFNGAGSIFWRRIKTTFADGIVNVMNNVDVDCFNSENLINQFDTFQNCFPEEIWRLDIERKYIRTFTGASVDDSITTGKQNPRFLTSMMQGRKKYQRRQWIRDQGVYFNSKYRLTDITRNENTIEFNIITPTNASVLALTPDYDLKLTPYQDMYLNVQVGNGNYQPQIRAKAGQTYTIDLARNTSGTFQETRIYINGFNSISGIGNLAPMYPYSFTLSALEHLKILDLGTDTVGYSNANFTSLPFEETTQLPLLETLNIKNCNALSGSIKLNTANNLRTIEAVGTAITGVVLPDYSNIETLHLPASVSAISLYGARFLKDFSMINAAGQIDYSGLYTLHIYDSDYSANFKANPSDPLPVDWISIALAVINKKSLETNLSLLKLSSATIVNINTLESLSDFKTIIDNATIAKKGQIELSGIINVTGYWSTIERDYYGGLATSIWPSLEFNTSAGTEQTKHKVTYRYDDYQDDNGNIVTGSTIKIIYINDGATAPDIYKNGTIDYMPSRNATVRESYEFGEIDGLTDAYIEYSGWKLAGSTISLYEAGGAPIIRNDTVIETHFNTNARTYYVKWYMRRGVPSSLVKTSTAPIEYGEGYNLEAPTVTEIHEAGQDTCTISIGSGSATYSIFTGWEKLPTNISPTATDETYDIYATWNTNTVIIDDLFSNENLSNLTPEQLLVLSALDATGKNTYGINSKITEGTRVTYELGHDSNVTGTALISGNPFRFDSSSDTSYATNIQPLKAGNDAFTLAIDYCFNPNATYANQYSFAVLASCYYGPISTLGIRNGFGLFYGTSGTITGPRVGFGDMYNDINQSVLVGNENTIGMRNMVVLRHPAGSDTLYVYSGLDNGNNLPATVSINTLSWSNYNSNAYLNFGRLTSESIDSQDGTPQIITNAKGTIFWAKYWNEDLGQGECKRLAAWPHEKMTYAISRLNQVSTSTTRVSTTQTVTPSIYLSALSSSAHGKVAQSRQSGIAAFSGRDNSIARTICNQRIFEGLPTQLQAIMCQPTIGYTVVNYSYGESTGATYAMSNTAALGKDYVFQYSAANLINDNSSIYATREDTYSHPFAWYNSTNVAPYTYSTTNGWTVNNSDGSAADYLNIRFPFKAISWGVTNKLRVFRELTTALPTNTTIAATIFSSTGSVNSGDIYIDTNNKTYIFVTNNEIQALGIQTMPTTGDNAKFATNNAAYRGGWVQADAYWTRSAIAGNNGANFAYAEAYGYPNISTINSASSLGLSLMYTISI